MRTRIISGLATLGAFALPLLAFADPMVSSGNNTTVNAQDGIIGLIRFANVALNDIIVVMITLAIVVFFYGLVRYIVSDGEARAEGLKTIFYSIVAIFIMVSIWGIIQLLQSTFGIKDSGSGASSAHAPTQVEFK